MFTYVAFFMWILFLIKFIAELFSCESSQKKAMIMPKKRRPRNKQRWSDLEYVATQLPSTPRVFQNWWISLTCFVVPIEAIVSAHFSSEGDLEKALDQEINHCAMGTAWLKQYEKSSGLPVHSKHRAYWKRAILFLTSITPKLFIAMLGSLEAAFAFIVIIVSKGEDMDYYIGNWPMIYHFMEEMEHDVLFVEGAHENTNIFLRIIGFFLLILCLLLHSVIAVALTICEKRLSIREFFSFIYFVLCAALYGVTGAILWQFCGLELPIGFRTRLVQNWENGAYVKYCTDVLETTDYPKKL